MITVFAFLFLLLAKVVISGIYLHITPVQFSTTDLALAEEEETQSDSSITEKERLLRKKEMELKEQEIALKKMGEELLPLKKEIDAKFEELNELQVRLTAFAKELAEREKALNDAKIGHIVTLYSAMDAARAAVIMDKLNIDTIVRILANMKGKSAGQILAMMEPEKGAIISEKLSRLE